MEPYLELEKRWADFNGVDPEGMVACSSGTAALHLGLEALRACSCLSAGDEVVVPDFTMVACARAVAMAGMTPVFVDCTRDGLLDLDLLDRATTEGMRAAMAVHVYGRQLDMFHLASIAKDLTWWLIEDLAEAHGTKPSAYTDVACWSFYKNKIVAGEEGGAVWFAEPAHAKTARSLRSLGFTATHDFQHLPRGHNYRLSNAHASLVLTSLDCYQGNLGWRKVLEALYEKHCPTLWRMEGSPVVPWVYPIIPPLKVSTLRKALYVDAPIATLKRAGVQARHFFKPMHEQPEFQTCKFIQRRYPWCIPYPTSSLLACSGLYLPLSPEMNEGEVMRAFGILSQYWLPLPAVPMESLPEEPWTHHVVDGPR